MQGRGPPALQFSVFFATCGWASIALTAQPCFLLPGIGGSEDEPSAAQIMWVAAWTANNSSKNRVIGEQ